ncbi:MAG: LD-carboxypeptidase [Deltaproteobacteria bacterium]|nr:LD-carboxypeptidase [Deltaproteobacteria bacterium]
MTPLLRRGAEIAVIAPSGAYQPHRLEEGLRRIEAEGYRPVPFEGMLSPERYLAAPDAVRLAHLCEALTDPRWDAVWMVRGGYGLTRLLADLPWEALPPRPVIGFSDVTALLLPLFAAGSPVIHGPMPHSLPGTDEASVEHLFRLLAGAPLAPLEGEQWVRGSATGWLAGGNLTMLASLCGTPWQPDLSGAIAVLEDVGEAPYRLDRALQQLCSAGVLDGVAGVALGSFTSCEPPAGASWTLREVLLDHLAPLGVPVVAELPIGHGEANRAFPFGASATLAGGRLWWAPR